MLKLNARTHFVGVLNPNLRVFDIIMKTEYGTTYNAYIVRGEKTALIETAHSAYRDAFFEEIEQVLPLSQLDYIILNHTEPDHSGSLSALMDAAPHAQVLASAAGLKNLSAITNRTDIPGKAVKTGEQLDLGDGVVLQFIIAPNLHWPDSMFTYMACEETLFSCDFLGAHYCEPRILDTHITYPGAYDAAFRGYYDAIFGPFKPFVLSGLEKIKDLPIRMVCNSHGPVLTDGIEKAMAQYRAWSTPPQKNSKRAAIFYVSAYGYTRQMAEVIAAAMNQNGVSATAYDIIEHGLGFLKERLEEADAVCFGSPTINRDALKPVWDLLSMTDAIINKDKPCMIFGSYGWSGEACGMLEQRVDGLKLKRYGDSLKVNFCPSAADIQRVTAQAEAFAQTI